MSGAYVCVCGHKLSLTAALLLPPTPPAVPTVSARSRSLSTRNLRLLFRAADVGLLRSFLHSRGRHTVSLVPPTHRGRSRLHYRPPARQLPSLVCDAMPTPGPDLRCADALTPLRLSANHFTHSESAYGLEQGQVGLLSAVQAPQQKACRSVPPRHLLFALILCRHSEFPAFLWLTSLPLRAASSSPHIAIVYPLDLLVSASRESGAVAKVNFHVAEI